MYTVVSPWPPQRNGIADYAAALAGAGRSCVRVVTEAAAPFAARGQVAFATPAALRRSGSDAPILYHVGNNADHVFVARLFLERPDVVCLHDLSLHHLAETMDARFAGFLDARLDSQLGEGASGPVRRAWRDGWQSALDHQLMPMLDWLEPARAIIVHSRTAAAFVRGRLPKANVRVIPHFAPLRDFCASDWGCRRDAARARIGLPQDAFVITMFGFVTPAKQHKSVVEAIRRLPAADRKRIVFVVAGAENRSGSELDVLLRADDGFLVRRMGYIAEDLIDLLFRASDLVPTLRYPSFAESSGAVARALGAGCAIIAPNHGAYAEIPDHACFKVRYGPQPESEIEHIISQAMANPADLMARRIAAHAYARTALSIERCAAALEEVVYG